MHAAKLAESCGAEGCAAAGAASVLLETSSAAAQSACDLAAGQLWNRGMALSRFFFLIAASAGYISFFNTKPLENQHLSALAAMVLGIHSVFYQGLCFGQAQLAGDKAGEEGVAQVCQGLCLLFV